MAADPIVRTYDPKLIIATFGGVPATGFASGTFLTITQMGIVLRRKKEQMELWIG